MSSKSKRKKNGSGPRKRPHIKNLGMNCNLPPEFEIGMEGLLPQIVLRRTTHKKVKETSASGEFDRQQAETYQAIATHAWRAKERMLDPVTHEPLEGMSRILRNVEDINKALVAAGVTITEKRPGDIYDMGMKFKALSFEPTPGISREQFKEIFSITVQYNGNLIMGEVIVATPVEETPKTGGMENE